MTSLRALRRALVAFAGLAIAFMVVAAVVAAGDLNRTDRQVAATVGGLWRSWMSLPAQAVAVLGGIELTTAVCAAVALYLWRLRFRAEAWGIAIAFPLANAVELLYKHVVYHPGPSGALSHGDGPSISMLLESGHESSFPSGHMTRTVLAYGLAAFVAFRMVERRWMRVVAVSAATLLTLVMAADRLYLGVHWESDVLGGALLGAVALSAVIIWLDRPHGRPRE